MTTFKREVADWQYEVANGDTILGLDEWTAHKQESDPPMLVCDDCGEAFDSIATADHHGRTDCHTHHFTIQPESEAM